MRTVAADLRSEARATDERRLLVLAGSQAATAAAVDDALVAADVPRRGTTLVSHRSVLDCDRLAPDRAGELLGTTRTAVVVDCHDECRPNALGRAVGAVDGGGLLVLLVPPLGSWPDRRDGFDEGLAVPPAGIDDVTGRFRTRLVGTLRAHRGVAIVDVDADRVVDDGLTGRSSPRAAPGPPDPASTPTGGPFPAACVAQCRTADQAAAVRTLEALAEPGNAVVLEADRGRGKSSAAGIAAGGLAASGRDVLVTAPAFRNAREVLVRAAALLADLDGLAATDGDPPRSVAASDGGRVRFRAVTEAVDLPGDPDAVVVDEAAAVPVHRLEAFLSAPAVGFATTVRGYEGAGRGFSVRFRGRLADSELTVREATLTTPIRYAPADPVEVWAFRALLLDAGPPAEQLIRDATPETVTYRQFTPEDLLVDEHRLRAAFGLLVLAHYRTEPDDLARLLDAPNLSVRGLTHDDHVVSVALVADEGGLDAHTRRRMLAGERIHGNMIPDVLTAHLRDEAAGRPRGWRVVRIATHPAVRSRGLGSRLLDELRAEARAMDRDWVGTGFGATPELLRFWQANGFGTVHLSTTRNDTSGEYSAILLDGLTPAGRTLHARHADRFVDRVGAMLSGPLSDADPDVIRAALRATATAPDLDLAHHEWMLVAGAGAGLARLATDPGPFRRLAVRCLTDGDGPLDARAERLLVRTVLQGRPAETVADDLGYPSGSECMRALGTAVAALIDRYGTDAARAELERLQ